MAHKEAHPLSILLLELEFSQWNLAKRWSYIHQLGLEEGFKSNHVHCDVITTPFLPYLQSILKDKHYDQVWIEIVHQNINPSLWSWICKCAPIRVGLIAESLDYTQEEIKLNPRLESRKDEVYKTFSYLTHVIAVDEKDVKEINSSAQYPNALWWVPAIPKSYVQEGLNADMSSKAIFSGALYGQREKYINHPDLKSLLDKKESLDGFWLARSFDGLHGLTKVWLKLKLPKILFLKSVYIPYLRTIRKKLFKRWMKTLQKGCASVNLPHLVKAYPGRVIESMAAGVPVITWQIPDRPKTAELFEQDKEVVLFDASEPLSLAHKIQLIQSDRRFAESLVLNARKKLLTKHTMEERIKQFILWIETNPFDQPIQFSDVLSKSDQQESFYEELWNSKAWGGEELNKDESERWEAIQLFLDENVIPSVKQDTEIQILDLGCGRGWLSKCLSQYGNVLGIDSLESSVQKAQELFPDIHFEMATPDDLLEQGKEGKFDIIVSSEVIEHVPNEQKKVFLESVYKLLKPDGHLILTTPRGELWEEWQKLSSHWQPVEDWISEHDLDGLCHQLGFQIVKRNRAHIFHRPFNTLSRIVCSRFIRLIRGYLDRITIFQKMLNACKVYQVVLLRRPKRIESQREEKCEN